MGKSEIAVFNLDRTVTDFVYKNMRADIEDTGMEPPMEDSGFKRLSTADQRSLLLRWFTDLHEDDIEPLLDITADRTYKRLAPWAGLVVRAEAEAGREICLYSSTIFQPLLEAYADGIEKVVPGVSVDRIFGKPLLVEDEIYTGETGSILKAEVLEGLMDEGSDIEFVADSFKTALPAIRKARRPLFVNPEPSLLEQRATREWPILYWEQDNPAKTALQLPDEEEEWQYDLTIPEYHNMLLEDLGY